MTENQESTAVKKNEPYSGQYTAHITSLTEKLIGTTLKPNEKVFILLETLKDESEVDPFNGWTVGVIKNKNPENEPTCVPLDLLQMDKRVKAEIRAAKKLQKS